MLAARADVVVVGGGVAGLWCRAALHGAGYGVVLIETTALGAGQTVASQGILHSGVKYAFSEQARAASDALSAAQGAWDAALSGRAGPDLRRVRVLADRMFLWTGGVFDKLTAVAAAKVLTARVRRLEPQERPEAFALAPSAVAVWELDERAIDPRSLVETLGASAPGPMVLARPGSVRVQSESVGPVARVNFTSASGDEVEIAARFVVLAAGEGNEAMTRSASIPARSQRRPLHMVMMAGAPATIFGHCPQAGSDKPRLTVTTAEHRGERVWYLGGEVAESGVERDEASQIQAAKAEVASCLGWLDVSGARWATFRIDRAEGDLGTGRRPDGPVLAGSGRCAALWPTKLALAPAGAAGVVEHVRRSGPPGTNDIERLAGLDAPPVAPPPWEREGVRWS